MTRVQISAMTHYPGSRGPERLTYDEYLAMADVHTHGPRWAREGSSSISDAAWNLQRRGIFLLMFEAGSSEGHHVLSRDGAALIRRKNVIVEWPPEDPPNRKATFQL